MQQRDVSSSRASPVSHHVRVSMRVDDKLAPRNPKKRCCACAPSGHAAAASPIKPRNSRRLKSPHGSEDAMVAVQTSALIGDESSSVHRRNRFSYSGTPALRSPSI
jgi:hypothetical protein